MRAARSSGGRSPGCRRLAGGGHRALLWVLLLVVTALAAQSPQRIISAAPSITEMLYALDLGHRVVAVTEFCHFPPEVRQKPKIGTYLRPNLETILEMRPDLVVVLQEHGDLINQMQRVRLPVLGLRHNTLQGIRESLFALGEKTGTQDRARQVVREIDANLSEIRSKAADLPERKVMFVIGRTPGTVQDLMVVGREAFLNELITIAGGRNVFSDTKAYYPRIPREEVYARGPDVIIDMGDMGDTDRVTPEHERSTRDLWSKLAEIPAVRSGRVYPVAEDLFVVPGPRVVEAARLLFRMIHPEAAR